MSGLAAGGVAFAALLTLLALGVPVAYAMALVASAGLWLTVGETFLFSTLERLPYTVASDYAFAVVPMFVLMGIVASRGGMIGDLYAAAHRFSASLRGGLLMATVAAQAAFAAVSGSTVVAASVFTRMALPEMLRFGYHPGVAAGCIAAAGTLAGLIPPSIAMVLYAALTGLPVGQLLIAGILPGLLTAGAYMVGVRLFLVRWPEWAPASGERFPWRARFEALGRVWSVLLLMVVVMGGIYGGVFPPSAAGAMGAAGAIVIALAMRRIGASDIRVALVESARISAVIFLVVIAGLLFSRFLLISGFIGGVRAWVAASEIGVAGFLAITVAIFLVLGMFIDSVSLLVVTTPFLYPVAQSLGIDGIWFGVLVVKLIEIAAITPPVGLNLFAVLAAAEGKVTARQLYGGVAPFFAIELVVLGLLIAFPDISTALPRRMG